MSFRRWVFQQQDRDTAAQLAEECQLDPFLTLLLCGRGVNTPERISDFLLGHELEEDPFGFADMDAAVERIQRAIDTGERIAVFGDYDADGVTSTVLLYSYLKEHGADVFYRIPQREGEGYGLHIETVDQLAEDGAQLIVTVDNGIAAVDETAHAKNRGIDIVITDHHRPQERLPDAVAVVDPHRDDCESGFKDYEGVGVALKLVCALDGDTDAALEKYADLAAIGTLADVMPLHGENRALVRYGLREINESPRPGLLALMRASGFSGKTMTATSTVFTIAPRINAAGRMGSPDKAAQLLLSENEEEAGWLAEEINQLNTQRQTVEASILTEVLEHIRRNPALLNDRVLVLSGENWHPGVVGILASRIVERYGKPCIMISVNAGKGKGSGRSVKGFSLFEALCSCDDCLLAFGGHELAAGVELAADGINRFRERINRYAAERYPVMPVQELLIDAKIPPEGVDLHKCEVLEALEPFGTGNPVPLFALCRMRLDNIAPVGGGKHLRLSVSRGNTRLSIIYFRMTTAAFPVECGSLLDFVVTLDRNEYRGVVNVSIVAKDIRYSDTQQDQVICGLADFERVLRREPIPAHAVALLIPSREQTASVYRYLRAFPQWQGTLEQLYHGVGLPEIGWARMRLILEVLQEAGLVAVHDTGGLLQIALNPAQGKADLQQTPVMQYLHGILPAGE